MPNGRNASVADGTNSDSITNKAQFSDHILTILDSAETKAGIAALCMNYGIKPVPGELVNALARLGAVTFLVHAAMLRGGDGRILDAGWNITKLNEVRPLVQEIAGEMGGAL